MKLPYREGILFAVPLRDGGFAVGLVARAASREKVILCYFFGPRIGSVPVPDELDGLKPDDAVTIIRIGDLSLIRGEWPIIGDFGSWNRSDWRMPPFLRQDDISRRAWIVRYSDDDPNVIIHEKPCRYGMSLERDGVYGSGAVELVLTRLLRE